MVKKGLGKLVKSTKDFAGLGGKKNTDIQLISGSYAPAEAADILLSFVNDKIKFHTVKKLNGPEHQLFDETHSDLRIEELREAKRTITNLVLEARNKGMLLEIDSTIQIALKEAVN